MRLTVELVRAEDDLPPRDSAIQTEFTAFGSTLRAANITYTQRAIAFDGGGVLGYPLGQFVLDFTSNIQPILTAAVTSWFLSRKGRKVRMKIDGMDLEANSIEEMDKLIKISEAIREGRPLHSEKEPHDPDSKR